MPAVTVEDILVLPRVPDPDPATTVARPVAALSTAPSGLEGEGFPVLRAFAGLDRALLDPFVHMDQMGAVDWEPGSARGTSWHPHRGFETVTYMLDGVIQHEDSFGGGGLITDGATQWMTAGSGILHKEAPPPDVVARGGLFHGIQLWVNLPAALKMSPPRYQDIAASAVRLLASHDGGALLRIIAGTVAGHDGPGITHTPIALLHATLSPGARLRLPWRPDFNALVWAFAGAGTIGPERRPMQRGQLAALADGDVIELVAADERPGPGGLDVLLLGGLPIREPIAAYGPFVMNTRAELQQAFDDFNAGRLGRAQPG